MIAVDFSVVLTELSLHPSYNYYLRDKQTVEDTEKKLMIM